MKVNRIFFDRLIKRLGLTAIANACDVTHQAVKRWQLQGRWPHTEYSGKTRHCENIAQLANGELKAEDLRQLILKDSPTHTEKSRRVASHIQNG